MNSGVSSANGRNGRTAGNDELIVLTLVISGIGLSENHIVKVQAELTHVGVGLVDGQLAGANAVEGGRVALVLEVGAVIARTFAASFSN